MIRAQQTAHRRVWLALALVLPLVLALALWQRTHQARALAAAGTRGALP